MFKKGVRERAAQKNLDIGICFEPLEPRLLLSGSVDAGAGGSIPVSPPLMPNDPAHATEAFFENNGTHGIDDQHRNPAANRTTDIAAQKPDSETDATSPTASATTASRSDLHQTDDLVDSSYRQDRQMDGAHELVFIDSGIRGFQQIVDDLTTGSASDSNLAVVVLDEGRDGIEQISRAITDRQDIDAVHFMTHGTDRAVKLGGTWLEGGNLDAYADPIAGWKESLADGADLLFYGCNLAAGEQGRSLLGTFRTLTDTDILASVDGTGHSRFGGDWDLEYAAGNIETGLPLSKDLQDNWQGLLAVAANDTYSIDEDTSLVVTAPGVLANDTGAPVSPTPGQTLGYDAGQDNDGDGIWQETGGSSGFDWTLHPSVARTNTPTTALPGITAAYVFNGSGGGTAPPLKDLAGIPSDDSASFEIWFKPSDAVGSEILFETGKGSQGTSLSLNGSVLLFKVNSGVGGIVGADIGAQIAGGEFIQAVGVIDFSGAQADLHLYVNGELAGSVIDINGLGQWADDDGSGLGQVNGSANTPHNDNFVGQIAGFRFYEKILTGAEVKTNFNAAAGVTPLMVTGLDTTATVGSVTVNPDGSFSYTPPADWSGTDSFGYTADDGVTTDSATVTINVNPVNDAPLVSLANTTSDLSENTDTTTRLKVADIQVSDDSLGTNVLSLSGADAAMFEIDGSELFLSSGTTLDANANPNLDVIVAVNDATLAPNPNDSAALSINITGANAAPIVDDQNFTVDENAVNGTVVGTVAASDGSPADNYTMLYWVDVATDELRRINLDGTDDQQLVIQTDGTAATGMRSVAVDDVNGRVYWVNNDSGQIWRADLDGANPEPLLNGLNWPMGIAVDAGVGKLYWFDAAIGDLWQADLDGANAQTLITSGPVSPKALAIDAAGGKIYWTDNALDAVMRANLDGSAVETIIAGLDDPYGIALDTAAGKVYWAEPGLGEIHRADVVVGAVPEAAVTGLLEPRAVTVDSLNGRIYYADAGADRIERADLDGSNIEVVTATGDWPMEIVIGPPVQNLTYAITGGNTNGAFAIDPVSGQITVANGAELDFETAAVFHLQVTLTDAGGLADSATIRIDLNNVNEPPVADIGPAGYGVDEDDTPRLLSGLGITDVDAASGDLSVTLTVANGTLTLLDTTDLHFTAGGNGTRTMTFTANLSAANTALNALSYQPDPDFNGTDNLILSVNDQGHSGSGGAKGHGDTAFINVRAINDTPQNSVPGLQSTNEDTALTFSAANGNPISISDVDAGNLAVQVTLTATHGDITLNGVTGLTFATGNGTADTAMTFSGTMTDINAALDGLTFTPSTDYAGPASLQITTNDLGHTGAGGALSDTDTVDIDVSSANDPPAVSLANAATSLAEDTDTTGPIKVADIVITDDGTGTNDLSLSGSDAALFEIVGSQLFLKAGVSLDFESKPALDVTVTVDDTAVGATPDDTAALSITITDVNEPPAVSLVNTVTSLSEDTDTTGRIKMADIVVTDEALGTNDLSLSGVDATLFEIDGSQLFLRAGVALDFETHPNLEVTVAVDDTTVGATPDDTAAFSLAVTHVNEAPSATHLNSAETYTEDVPLNLADIVVTDVDGSHVSVTLTLSDPAAGRLSTGTSGAAAATFANGVWTAAGPIADVNALLAAVTFTPAANCNGHFTIAATVQDDAGGWLTGVKPVTGTPVGDTPQVGDAQTRLLTPSAPIVIDRNTADGAEVTHFRITGITNGNLYQADGVTPIHNGDFITHAQAQAGVRFVPTDGSGATGSFAVEASEDGIGVSDQSGAATATIAVIMPQELPSDNDDPGNGLPDDQDNNNGQDDPGQTEEQADAVEENLPEEDSTGPGPGRAPTRAGQVGSISQVPWSQVMPAGRDIQLAGVISMDLNQLMDQLFGAEAEPGGRPTAAGAPTSGSALQFGPPFGDTEAVTYAYLQDSLDDMKEEMAGEMQVNRSVVGSAIVMSTGLSVGYVVWLLRSGMLLSSLLSSMPAWRILDPLPILAGRRDDSDAEDEESLQTILKNSPQDADISEKRDKPGDRDKTREK